MGHDTSEWVFVGIVIAILVYVGVDSWNIEKLLEDVPASAETIKVTGQQWFWSFEHADGTKEISTLHLKKGHAYKFEIYSKDVDHSFNIPDWVVFQDAIPGRINHAWFSPDQTGEFPIQCREYCGLLHYNMRGSLVVEEDKT
jgi:cytochrome c oxidase subunit II